MGWFEALTFEAGEDHGDFTNLNATVPIVDEVEAGGLASCPFNKRWQFGSFDIVSIDNEARFNKAAAGDPMVMGFALKIEDLGSFTADHHFYFRNETNFSDAYVGIDIDSAGGFVVRRDSTGQSQFDGGTALGGAPAGTFQSGVEHFVVMRAIFDNSAGEFQVWVDGQKVVDLTGVDTNDTTGTILTTWGWGMYVNTGSVTDGNYRMGVVLFGDDLPNADTTGTKKVAYSLAPDGVTADNDGTPTGAATNNEATDEAPADGGTTYTTLSAVGKQGFTFANLPADAEPPVLVWLAGAIGDPADGGETVNGYLDDGTTEDASGAVAVNTSFAAKALTDKEPLDPSGGAWTKATVDALTGGIERTT